MLHNSDYLDHGKKWCIRVLSEGLTCVACLFGTCKREFGWTGVMVPLIVYMEYREREGEGGLTQ